MGIKKDNESGLYTVSYAKRHPITRKSVDLKRKNIKSLAEARRVHADLILQVNEKIKRRITPAWGEFIETYFRSLEGSGISMRTRYSREKLIRYYTMPVWQTKLIDEILADDINKLLADRLSDKAESYRKFFVKCIKGVFRYAMEKNVVDRNPTPLLKFKIKSKIKAVLNADQICVLLRKAQEQSWPWYPHYSLALYTGLRNGELYALRWNNVNLEKRQILVNCSWNSKDGYKPTKSGNDRIVEIPNALLPVLRDLKLRSAESDFVLPRLDRWNRGEQARELRLFLRAIGLHEVRFHDLRASWATLLLDKDVPPAKVMAQWVGGQTSIP